MEVIPAIDLRGGKCVRLFQGDFAQETVFSDDPVGVAVRWQACGAPRIHVVDLDGAASGHPANAPAIEAITQAVSIPVQVGGGLRTMEAVDGLLSLGVDRVVLGTAAAEDPDLVRDAIARHGEAIVVGIDARDGKVATQGWTLQGAVEAMELLRSMEGLGVSRFIYTDIARDGAMQGPNLEAIQRISDSTSAAVIAAGGVASLEHLRQLAGTGVEGAIVGRAVYTGEVDLREAVRALGTPKAQA